MEMGKADCGCSTAPEPSDDMKRILVVGLLAGFTLPLCAQSQTSTNSTPQAISVTRIVGQDANQDGKISLAEQPPATPTGPTRESISARRAAAVAAIKPGRIAALKAAYFKKCDVDESGTLDAEEQALYDKLTGRLPE